MAEFAEFALNEGGISPYPSDQLAWGYQADEERGKFLYLQLPLQSFAKLVGRISNYFDEFSPLLFLCSEMNTQNQQLLLLLI